jgi:glycogen debranching enzyme
MTQPIIIENPNPRDHLRTEWLLTNGLGGYAMGTVLGINTRRYHGLLVAATNPPVGRIVALHSMIEQLIIPRADGMEEVIDLSTQMFVGPPPDGEPMIHPEGWKHLTKFELGWTSAVWTYQIGESRLIRTINWHPNQALAITYLGSHLPRSRLRLRPLLSLRDCHSLNRDDDDVYRVAGGDEGITIARDNVSFSIAPAGFKVFIAPVWVPEPEHWNRFAYIHDRERGQEWTEDSWTPGYFEGSFLKSADDPAPPQVMSLGFTADPLPALPIQTKRNNHRRLVARAVGREPSVTDLLHAAASDFVVMRQFGRLLSASIIAGYPWFSDWGRDAMISLPGLLLCTKRFEEAKSVLLLFASHLRNGLIPNHFDDHTGEPRYNTVDASLWFIYAVWQYWKATNPLAPGSAGGSNDNQRRSHNDLRAESGAKGVDPVLLSACRDIIHAYRTGTHFNIFMDPTDGLISAGNETTQLTWMDAARDSVIFTPRHGKPVEVNALWFNALHFVAEMTDDPDEARALRELASTVGASFRAKFWNQEREYLNDVLVPQSPGIAIRGCQEDPVDAIVDSKLRPNQIFAVSLPFSALSREQQRAVVNTMRDRLLTPYGLRTLDRDDRDYRGRFEGNLFERDRAYHNGTAWPWLLGPYCEAVLHLNDFSDDSKREVREILQPLLDELSRTSGPGCLGQLAEVYDGDPPQRPGGCVAQAWSVAEVLRILTLIGDPPPTVASS